MSESSSDSIFTRGVISSSAVRSPNCSERSTSIAVPLSMEPRCADVRTRDPSSCGDRAERNSSAGSMPRRRTIQLAVPLRPLMAHRKISENPACRPAVARAVGIGLEIARFFGTSSPKIMENEVAITRARIKDVVEAADSLSRRPS